MGISAKALIGGATIMLAITFITLMVLVFGNAQEGVKQSSTEFSSIQTELSGQAFAGYDNTVVSGSQVVNALRKYNIRDAFEITVVTKKTSAKYAKNSDVKNVVDITKSEYINPSGQFKGEVLHDENNVVKGITFTQQ